MERSSFQIGETHDSSGRAVRMADPRRGIAAAMFSHAIIFRLGIAVFGAHEIVVVAHRLLSWERNILKKIIKGAGMKFLAKFEWGNAYSLSASCNVSWTF